jgi:hypothetical protein
MVMIRLSAWREAIASTPCHDCGAAPGHGCDCGFSGNDDCAGCGMIERCARGTQLHVSRFNAWLRPHRAKAAECAPAEVLVTVELTSDAAGLQSLADPAVRSELGVEWVGRRQRGGAYRMTLETARRLLHAYYRKSGIGKVLDDPGTDSRARSSAEWSIKAAIRRAGG